MDLALELGMTLVELKSRMSVAEFYAWKVYAGRKMLPTRRIELQLAKVTQSYVGGKLFDHVLSDQVRAEATAEQVEAEQPVTVASVAIDAASTVNAMTGGGRRVIVVGRKKGNNLGR